MGRSYITFECQGLRVHLLPSKSHSGILNSWEYPSLKICECQGIRHLALLFQRARVSLRAMGVAYPGFSD